MYCHIATSNRIYVYGYIHIYICIRMYNVGPYRTVQYICTFISHIYTYTRVKIVNQVKKKDALWKFIQANRQIIIILGRGFFFNNFTHNIYRSEFNEF